MAISGYGTRRTQIAMYSLTAYTTRQRVGVLDIGLEFGGAMKDFVWSWTGMGLSSRGDGGWAESDDGRGYFITLTDDKGDFAFLHSKLWERAVQNKNKGEPHLPWFPRKRNFKGTVLLLAAVTLPTLEWELF